MSSDEMIVEILKIVNDLKEDVKENRREIQKSREIEEAHWQENEKRWEENRQKWEKYEINRKADRRFLLDALTSYDISISEQLGDPNVEKMRKIV